jgi:hypothetical protein
MGSRLTRPRRAPAACRLTLAEFFRWFARYGPGSHIVDEDGLVLFAGSHGQPNPFRNGAIRLDSRLDAEESLARAQRFFSPLKRSYVIWVREGESDLDALCRSHGMELVEPDRLPEFYLSGPPQAPKPHPKASFSAGPTIPPSETTTST